MVVLLTTELASHLGWQAACLVNTARLTRRDTGLIGPCCLILNCATERGAVRPRSSSPIIQQNAVSWKGPAIWLKLGQRALPDGTVPVWAVAISVQLRLVEPYPVDGVLPRELFSCRVRSVSQGPPIAITSEGGTETLPVAPFAQKKSSETRIRTWSANGMMCTFLLNMPSQNLIHPRLPPHPRGTKGLHHIWREPDGDRHLPWCALLAAPSREGRSQLRWQTAERHSPRKVRMCPRRVIPVNCWLTGPLRSLFLHAWSPF
jgi:hypothetical protein